MTSSARISAVIAICCICLFLALVFLALIKPLADWRSATIDKVATLAAEEVALQQRLADLQSERESFVADDLAGMTWEAEQPAQATARVQSAINDIARSNAIQLRSIVPTSGAGAGFAPAVAFRLEFETTLDNLVPFLKATEFHRPSIVLTRTNLRRLVRPNQVSIQPELFVQIDLAAPIYLRGADQE